MEGYPLYFIYVAGYKIRSNLRKIPSKKKKSTWIHVTTSFDLAAKKTKNIKNCFESKTSFKVLWMHEKHPRWRICIGNISSYSKLRGSKNPEINFFFCQHPEITNPNCKIWRKYVLLSVTSFLILMIFLVYYNQFLIDEGTYICREWSQTLK